ncbi:hypothetical protein HK100_000824 [Physocladia obscura]|uniref:Uncharacterized protein n=1 Tax=Physocladia obscura TaxID=109957 RepID=A0AAD5SXR8_9FUNG|nr:hypothetical protein HK100_000824 [Physocladia obscura]
MSESRSLTSTPLAAVGVPPLPTATTPTTTTTTPSTPVSSTTTEPTSPLPSAPPLESQLQKQQQSPTTILHENIHPHDRLISSIPALVMRLETLKPLHTRGALLSDAVAQVVASHRANVDGLESMEGLARMVDESIAANMDVMVRNMDAFDWRIMKLQLRIKELKVLRVESPQPFEDD